MKRKSKLLVASLILFICSTGWIGSITAAPCTPNGGWMACTGGPSTYQPCTWTVRNWGCDQNLNCSCSAANGIGYRCYWEKGICDCSGVPVEFRQCYLGSCNCPGGGEGPGGFEF